MTDDRVAFCGLAEVLWEVNRLLASHPLGSNYALTAKTSGFQIAQDEVLVQTVDAESRQITLRPKRISELTINDVLAEVGQLDPADAERAGAIAADAAKKGYVWYTDPNDRKENHYHIEYYT